jgi:hypothetical protein
MPLSALVSSLRRTLQDELYPAFTFYGFILHSDCPVPQIGIAEPVHRKILNSEASLHNKLYSIKMKLLILVLFSCRSVFFLAYTSYVSVFHYYSLFLEHRFESL